MDKYVDELLKLLLKVKKTKEIPVVAIVVYKDKIIARANNKRYKTNDVTSHAEIIAIKKASKKIRDWRLNECDLYVTLEPCEMCKKVIYESRINRVYYLLQKLENKHAYDKTEFIKIDNDKSIKYKEQLSSFFKKNCNR